MFKDTESMTAREKELVLKNWDKFLKQGLQKNYFTKRLYHHLYLYCGFIAHYDLGGFYSTYFDAGEDTQRFFGHFCNHTTTRDWNDINTAMKEVYSKYRRIILKQTENNMAERLKQLWAGLERATNDKKFAKKFLSGLKI